MVFLGILGALVLLAVLGVMTGADRTPKNGRVLVHNPAMYPDAAMTPGSTNPDVTQATIGKTICNPAWSTKSVRDTQSSPAQKAKTYALYDLTKPKNNTGANQQCELDHLISLQLGGSDKLDNIWPECGPAGVPINRRYFKQKDAVENYLHQRICSHTITLAGAQRMIVMDWYSVYEEIKTSYGRLGAVDIIADDPDDD